MDLLDPLSITAFASGFEESGRALDLLILSAGVMATPLFRDPAGREGQFATNHLGHFRLTAAPWPRLRGARSEEHTSELQSLMRSSSAVFCLKKQTTRATRVPEPDGRAYPSNCTPPTRQHSV